MAQFIRDTSRYPPNEVPTANNPQGETKNLKTAWEYYNESTEIIDREREKEWPEQMDTILIFAGLFAAFLSAFLIELLNRLEQDPTDVIQDILIHQTLMMRNTSVGPYVPSAFSPPDYVVAVNALFYASLGVMLLAAFVAMLIKSWVREFDRGLRGMSIPEQRAKTREFRYQGLVRWKLSEMVATLPLLIQLSLLLFSIGLSLFLSHVSMLSCGVITVILGIGVLFYAVTTSISILVSSSPFRSPLSHALGAAYQRMLSTLLPTVEGLMSHAMDLPPTTWHMSLWRQLRVYLYTIKPYSEGEFVKPFGDAPEDPMQLRCAAAALEWLHNHIPDSRESQDVHWAVWDIAGSAIFRVKPQLRMPQWLMQDYNDMHPLVDLPLPVTRLCTLTSMQWRFVERHKQSEHLGLHMRLDNSSTIWSKLVAHVDNLHYGIQSGYIVDIILSNEFAVDELLWLVGTLSQLWLSGSLRGDEPQGPIDICHSILFCFLRMNRREEIHQAKGVLLLNAVVTLAAIVLLPNNESLVLLTEQQQFSWSLSNLRSPQLLARMVNSAHSNEEVLQSANHLFFLLFLFLLRRSSFVLASQYFELIVGDNPSAYGTPVLAQHAPYMWTFEICLVATYLTTPQTQRLQLILDANPDSVDDAATFQNVLQRYDEQLGESEEPDPGFLVALLSVDPMNAENERSLQPHLLKNPWCALAAQAITLRDFSSRFFSILETWNGHTVPNLIAAASLMVHGFEDYTTGPGLQLLGSFFQSHEFGIAHMASRMYFLVVSNYPTIPVLPFPIHLGNAVQTIFNSHLTQPQLVEGWQNLTELLSSWGSFPIPWQQAFATAFFMLSSRQLPSMGEASPLHNGLTSLKRILTWGFVRAQKDGPKFASCSGIDWFEALSAIAGIFHQDGETSTVQPGVSQGILATITSAGLLAAFEKLLSATPYGVLKPLLLQIKEFTSKFEDTDVSDRVSSCINNRRIHDHQMFSCALYFE